MGWPWSSAANAADAEALIGGVCDATWERIEEAYLHNVVRRVEELYGKMRGHLLVEFKDTSQFHAQRYVCDKCSNRYWYLEKNLAGGTQIGLKCPACTGKLREGKVKFRYRCSRPSCHHVDGPWVDTWPDGGKWNGWECSSCHRNTMQKHGGAQVDLVKSVVNAPRDMVDSGVGEAGGATWLPDSFVAWEWAHEMGHHRHMEHAASADGRQDDQHDSEENTLPAANFDAAEKALNKRWDRCCVMSYVNTDAVFDNAVDRPYFCGRCVLKSAGWKVEAIEDPATNDTGPGGNEQDD
jgi:hypothetical protein